MNVAELAVKLNGRLITGEVGKENGVSGLYCCDLLSWVMSHAVKGDAWITVHTHMNILAVATLTEIACIVLPEGIDLETATLDRAMQKGIPVVSTKLNAYEICCIVHDSGI